MGPDWMPAGIECRRIAEEDLKRRGADIDRSKLVRPEPVPTPGLRTGCLSTVSGGSAGDENMLLSRQLREQLSVTPRSPLSQRGAAAVHMQTTGRPQESEAIARPRLQQASLVPEWWPGEPVAHCLASSSSLQAPPLRRPTTSAGVSAVSDSQSPASWTKSPITNGILQDDGLAPAPVRAATAMAGTPRKEVYPFQWRPTETSLIRESFNSIITKEQVDVTQIMQAQTSMGRKAEIAGLQASAHSSQRAARSGITQCEEDALRWAPPIR